MDNRNNVVLLDKVCSRYKVRPSEALNIDNDLQALDFDITVALIAERVEAGKPLSPLARRQHIASQIEKMKSMLDKAAKLRGAGSTGG